MRTVRWIVVGTATAVCLTAVAASASAKTITVTPGHSIQAAVDAANRGDTIAVRPGVYHGGVAIKKNKLTLRGAGDSRRGTVIKPGSNRYCHGTSRASASAGPRTGAPPRSRAPGSRASGSRASATSEPSPSAAAGPPSETTPSFATTSTGSRPSRPGGRSSSTTLRSRARWPASTSATRLTPTFCCGQRGAEQQGVRVLPS